MNFKLNKKENGFTLVELMVVVLIIGVTAKITLMATSEIVYKNRYELTQKRLDVIRKAIVGRHSSYINGQPNFSGFIADTGRLPTSIRELLQKQGSCSITTGNNNISEAQCDFGGGTWVSTTWSDSPVSISDSNLTMGWNGPYIEYNGNPDENNTFMDGWGRVSVNNYGWVPTFPAFGGSILIESYGKDKSDEINNDCLDYDDDCIINIEPSHYSRTITNLSARIITPDTRTYTGSCDDGTSLTRTDCTDAGQIWSVTTTVTTKKLCMKITYRRDSFPVSVSDIITQPEITEDGGEYLVGFVFTDGGNIPADNLIPMGINLIEIFSEDTTCSFSPPSVMYKHDEPIPFIMDPQSSISIISW